VFCPEVKAVAAIGADDVPTFFTVYIAAVEPEIELTVQVPPCNVICCPSLNPPPFKVTIPGFATEILVTAELLEAEID
jgi:hypothetical protein